MNAERHIEEHGSTVPGIVNNLAADRRLDLIRGEIEIQIGICIALLEIISTFLTVGYDGQAIKTAGDARERMRAVLAQVARLEQALKDASISSEAAAEWRSQSDCRRRA